MRNPCSQIMGETIKVTDGRSIWCPLRVGTLPTGDEAKFPPVSTPVFAESSSLRNHFRGRA